MTAFEIIDEALKIKDPDARKSFIHKELLTLDEPDRGAATVADIWEATFQAVILDPTILGLDMPTEGDE